MKTARGFLGRFRLLNLVVVIVGRKRDENPEFFHGVGGSVEDLCLRSPARETLGPRIKGLVVGRESLDQEAKTSTKRMGEAEHWMISGYNAEGEARRKLKGARRIVIKLGTSTVTDPTGGVCTERVEPIARAIAQLIQEDRQVMLDR